MHSSLPQQLDNFDFSNPPLKRVFTALEDAVLKSSRSVIVICKDLHDYVDRQRLRGQGRLSRELHGFQRLRDRARLRPEEVEAIRRQIAPGGEKIIFYAGNFEPYQGIPLLIEAMARVKGGPSC